MRLINMDEMKERTGMTLLCDGWEDAAGRSIYATVLAEVGQPPIVIGLTDMSGERATAKKIVEVVTMNLEKMGVDPKKISAFCTDNPSVMVAVRRQWEQAHPMSIVRLPS